MWLKLVLGGDCLLSGVRIDIESSRTCCCMVALAGWMHYLLADGWLL